MFSKTNGIEEKNQDLFNQKQEKNSDLQDLKEKFMTLEDLERSLNIQVGNLNEDINVLRADNNMLSKK